MREAEALDPSEVGCGPNGVGVNSALDWGWPREGPIRRGDAPFYILLSVVVCSIIGLPFQAQLINKKHSKTAARTMEDAVADVQATLGAIFKKPKCSEKLLNKPPFR